MNERKHRWECYHLLHMGEDRGKKLIVNAAYIITAAEAAERAAEMLNDEEMRAEGYDCACEFDQTAEYIEVVTADGPKRFCVMCEVEPRYTAQPLEEGKDYHQAAR